MNVIWTQPAIEDLKAIRDYIARDSTFYAQKVVGEAFDKTDNLVIWPNIGRRAPEESDDTIREITHYSYRIIYQAHESHVNILAVIHGRREYQSPKSQ